MLFCKTQLPIFFLRSHLFTDTLYTRAYDTRVCIRSTLFWHGARFFRIYRELSRASSSLSLSLSRLFFFDLRGRRRCPLRPAEVDGTGPEIFCGWDMGTFFREFDCDFFIPFPLPSPVEMSMVNSRPREKGKVIDVIYCMQG